MPLLDHTPRFSAAEAAALARDRYGVIADATPLPGERDQNFRLDTAPGHRFVLKIANALERPAWLEAERRALDHLFRSGIACARVAPTLDGTRQAHVRAESGAVHPVRLVTYVEGVPLGSLQRVSDALLRSLGAAVGRMDRALAGFDDPETHRVFHWDLARGLDVVREHLPLVDDELRGLIERIAADFERRAADLLPGLRRSVIHNDANDYNVIAEVDAATRAQRVAAVIDFGDMVHSYTVADPAVAVAYAVLDTPDPLAAAVRVVEGYHAAYPLEEDELAALLPLVLMRLCMSACLAAHQQRLRPGDDYLVISQAPLRRTLPRLARIHPRFAEASFRHACGLDPAPRTGGVRKWLEDHAGDLAPVIDADLRTEPCPVFDLSVGSALLEGNPDTIDEPTLTGRLRAAREAAGVRIGIGRYDEPRLLYTTTQFGGGPAGQRRTVHLGMDVFAEAGTPVYAPLPGTVHAVARNEAPLDYGPVLLLRHETDAGEAFFTLYGHLDEDVPDAWTPGDVVEAGQRIGALGTPGVNGGWTPHLHLQLIADLLDLDCAYPGVCAARERGVWTALSPDPNLILRIPEEHLPPPPPAPAETLARRRKRIGPNLSIGYDEPVKVEKGWMQYLYDADGRKYVDAYNNVPHVGHCHPRVVEAGRRQMGVLNTNTRYLHDLLNRYAERLAATLPDPLGVCFFVNSASEANELALRLARAYTGRRGMVVVEGAYHGHTTTLIDISPYKHDGPGGEGAPDWVRAVPLADVYRGPHRADDPEAGAKYAAYVETAVEALEASGERLCGFIAESCPSVGGQIFFPEGYLAGVYRRVREAGGVCIADEVQTGYGRIGTHFYAFEAQGVVPDVVVLGKPIGNGHPIGAVVTTPEIAASFDNGMEFFSTFGGNTVSCAVGLAVLDVVEEEGLQAHARQVGGYLLDRLRGFEARYPIVGDVRGSGLFLGMELVRDRATLEPAGEEASFIANRMRARGVLLGTDGPHHNVIKIRPPMPFAEHDADALVEALDRVLADDFAP